MAIRALLPALWLTLCLGLLPAGVAGADAVPTATDRVVTDHVTARLVSEKTALRPGEVAWLGLSLAMREGWHTYWENPGDSGEATRIAWTLPEGLTAGEIRWPHPRLIPVGPLANYGYEGQVTLLVPMRLAPGHTAPATGSVRRKFPFSGMQISAQTSQVAAASTSSADAVCPGARRIGTSSVTCPS